MIGVLAVSLALVIAASDAAAAPSASEARHRLDELIGDARCSSDSDCRSIAVGHRACGGPEFYLAWSIRTTRADALQRAAADYAAAQASTPPGDRFSTCEILHDPGAYCRRDPAAPTAGGTCRLHPLRPGHPSR